MALPVLPEVIVNNVTAGHNTHAVELHRDFNRRRTNPVFVEAQSTWDPIAADHAVALDAALTEAKAGSGGRTVLLPEVFRTSTMHNTEGVHVKGRGALQDGGGSEVRFTAAGAGFKMGDLTGTQRAGSFENFFVDAQNLATVPLSVGVVVRPGIRNVALKNSAGTGLLLQGTQNALIQLFSALYCTTDPIQLDRCGGCVIDKSEFGKGGRYNGNVMSGGPALPFTVDYPLQNTFRDCIFEYHTSTTIAMFRQGAGLDNALERCQFATDTIPTTAALRLIILEQAGTPFSTDLRLRDCTLQHNFTSASTVGVDIVGDQPRILGYGFHKIVGSNIGIRRNAIGGAVSYFGNVITVGVTTNKSTPVGNEAWINATFL